MAKTAILIDGAFYRKRAAALWGEKSPEARAEEMLRYAFRHLDKKDGETTRELYRIFYYDCPPSGKKVYHPLLKRTIDFSREPMYGWAHSFYSSLKTKRKLALRMGRLAENELRFNLGYEAVKRLVDKSISVDDLTEDSFVPSFKQKEVDMKLGIDVSSLAYEGIVNQIILIAGDSDFVPAAKIARRKGIDFILDPMGRQISPSLSEHVDGVESFCQSDPYPKEKTRKRQ